MNVESWLKQAARRLTAAGIGTARLDCLILLEDVTGHDRAWLLAHPEHQVGISDIDKLNNHVIQRMKHLPLAYIRGRSEFYGRSFYVDTRVLEPRPETEVIIELLLALPLPDRPVIVDVGTGSGALAITAKLELSAARVYATDIDLDCLAVARRNASALAASVDWLEADLLDSVGLPQTLDVVITNLPYVPDNFQINLAASHEPRLAIFGGPDGLDLYRQLAAQLAASPAKPTHLLAESLPPQHPALAGIMSSAGYTERQARDFIQVFELRN
jgi:release factor glutamine methyltransferase